MARVFDGRMGVEYGQAMFHAGGGDDTDGDLDGYFAGQLNGMLGAAVPGYIHIMTATHTGEVPFVVEVLDSEPPVDDSYEDIVEVSLAPAMSEVNIVCMMGWGDAAEFELTAPSYRVRMSARNADASKNAEDMGEEDHVPFDEYFLQLWPAAASPDAIVKSTSQWADWANTSWGSASSETFEKPVYPPNPWDDWNAENRHRALRYEVELAGAAVGISDDPAFIQLLTDSEVVFADYQQNPQAYVPSRNEYGWFDADHTPVQEAAFERYRALWPDPFRDAGGFVSPPESQEVPTVDEAVEEQPPRTFAWSDGSNDSEDVEQGTVELTVSYLGRTVWTTTEPDEEDFGFPDIDYETASDEEIAAHENALVERMQAERQDPKWREAQAWRAATELLTYYGFKANRDQRGASFIDMWAEDAMGRRMTQDERAHFYELLGVDPPDLGFPFPIPPGV